MAETYWRHCAFRTGRPNPAAGLLNVCAAGHEIAGRNFTDTDGRRNTLDVIWCKGGGGVVQNYGKEIKVSPGDCFFYLPESFRRMSGARGKWDYYWFRCDGPNLDAVIRIFRLKQELRQAGNCPEERFNTIIDSLRDIDISGAIRASAAAYEILLLALNPSSAKASCLELSEKYRELVAQNLADPDFSVQAATEMLAVHRSTLHRCFFASHGVSPQSYLTSCRLRQALEFLNSGMNVKEIAARCGFNAPHYFAKVFRRCFGKSPVEFRRTLMTVPPPGDDGR